MLVTYGTILMVGMASRWHTWSAGDGADAVHLAMKLGVSADALAASGLVASDAGVFLGNLEAATEAQQSLGIAEGRLDAAYESLSAAMLALDEQPGDPELTASREARIAELAQARAGVMAARGALLREGMAGLSNEQRARLTRWVSGACTSLPPSMRVGDLSPQKAKQANAAVRAQLRAQRTGGTVPGAASSVLQEVSERSDVSDAATKIATNKAAISAAIANWSTTTH